MSEERDAYMRRQEADHALLDMRSPRPSVFSRQRVRDKAVHALNSRIGEAGMTAIRRNAEARAIYDCAVELLIEEIEK